MPLTINGFGTHVCAGSARVRWEAGRQNTPDFDGVECFVVFFLPIVPLKTLHAHTWCGNEYKVVPLRWTTLLVARAFLRRWAIAVLLWSVVVLWSFNPDVLNTQKAGAKPPEQSAVPELGALAMAFGAAAALLFLWVSDNRDRKIRRVLGRHQFGSSDPVTWTKELIANVRDAQAMFDTQSYAEAARHLLKQGNLPSAMLAARLATAKEDKIEGEFITELILNDPRTLAVLARLRVNPGEWERLMRPLKPL